MPSSGSPRLDKLFNLAEKHPNVSLAIFVATAAVGLGAGFAGQERLGSPAFFAGMTLCTVSPFFLLCALMGSVIRIERRRIFEEARQLRDFKDMFPDEFERVVADAYREKGWKVEETGGPGDGGVDLILRNEGMKVAVQCKQWHKWQVGVRQVREFYGAMPDFDVDHGIFVTCGPVTKHARAYARRRGMEIVDRKGLIELMGEPEDEEPLHPPGSVNRPGPKPDQDSGDASGQILHFVQDDKGSVPPCPRCSGSMSLAVATSGHLKGRQLWKCDAHPDCCGYLEPRTLAA